MNFENKYKEIVDDLQPSSQLTQKLMKSEDKRLMRFTKKKAIVLIAVACMTLGTSVFAAGKIASYRSWSSNLTEETDINESRDAAKKLGVSLEIPESFSNGYIFDYSNSGGIEGLDEAGHAIANGKSFMVTYIKNEGSDIYLNVDPIFEELNLEEGYTLKNINGINVYFYKHTYKFVPTDYELTAEDLENMEKPGYEISYGSDEVQVQQCSGFIFDYESKIYNMLSFDSKLTDDEWYEMAEELINN